MGNKLGRRRQLVEDKYTRPQGLYDHRDVDQKKLRKLILEAKLSPCYPGHEDPVPDLDPDLDECPICFLYYPSLNRSRCCAKGICTECFLQMKPPHSSRSAQCPFCKTSNYAVEYRGVRTKEEKGMEQLEEQKLIEAKIRMRQQELLDEELRMLRKQEMSSSNTETTLTDAGLGNITVTPLDSAAQPDDVLPCEGTSTSPSSRLPNFGHDRRGDYNLDLEDLMVMEAIWLSIQETGPSGNSDLQNLPAVRPKESLPSGGLACAVAALAEHQNVDVSSSGREQVLGLTESSSSLASKNMATENDIETVICPGANWLGATQASESTYIRPASEWAVNQTNQVAESADTVYTGSDVERSMPTIDTIGEHAQATSAVSILPDSFDEQVMLAMALSLAEAQPRSNVHGMPWH